MTPAEQRFFGILELAVKDRFKVFSQVRLWSIVGVERGAKYGSRSKIDKKSVDFLLSDPRTMESLLVIELDDSSHDRWDRVERDRFVDQVLTDAGIRIMHAKVQSDYSVDEIFKQIEAALAAPISAHKFEEVSLDDTRLFSTATLYKTASVTGEVMKRVGLWDHFFKSKRNYSRRTASFPQWLKIVGLLIFLFILNAYVGAKYCQSGYEKVGSSCEKIFVPAHALLVGTSWYCETGYKKVGDSCEEVIVPAHAILSGTSWYCETGYKKVGDSCEEVIVPAHAILSGTSWFCETGYKQVGDACEEIIVPPHAHLVGTSWYCETGYKKVGEFCEEIIVPEHARLVGTDWYCETGYKKVGNSCVVTK